MIDPKSLTVRDLRIGNLVLCEPPDDRPIEIVVDRIAHDSLAKDLWLINGYDLQYVSGIKITPERLLRAGFEKNHLNNYIIEYDNFCGDHQVLIVIPPENIWNDKKKGVNEFPEGVWGVRQQNQILDSVALAAISYLHGLQNTLWDLARKEI